MRIQQTLGQLSAVLLIATSPAAWADEGHSHEEGPVAETGKPLPTVTTVSKEYELVGRLHHDELSILIDRAASTEPVLGASLLVEVEGRSANAPYQADRGDYTLNDRDIITRLQKPGYKALAFTLKTAGGAEVLNGDLDVYAEEFAENGSPPSPKGYAALGAWLVGGVSLVVFASSLLVFVLRWRKTARQQRRGGAA